MESQPILARSPVFQNAGDFSPPGVRSISTDALATLTMRLYLHAGQDTANLARQSKLCPAGVKRYISARYAPAYPRSGAP